jgi:uncharacterized protein (TIGR02611 family)
MNLASLKRVAVAVIGFTVLLIGVAMVVLPGPAIVVIPLGLAILATEFVWARRLQKKPERRLPLKSRVRKSARQAPTTKPESCVRT